MSSKKVWVGVLNDTEEFYIPSEYYEDDIYKGKDALPFFKTYGECLGWCANKNANIDMCEASLKIELNREEAKHLLNCLRQPIVNQEAISVKLEVEDILVNFLNATK